MIDIMKHRITLRMVRKISSCSFQFHSHLQCKSRKRKWQKAHKKRIQTVCVSFVAMDLNLAVQRFSRQVFLQKIELLLNGKYFHSAKLAFGKNSPFCAFVLLFLYTKPLFFLKTHAWKYFLLEPFCKTNEVIFYGNQ